MTDPQPLPRWGIVSTIKASAQDVLTFVAYHLEQGAHRVCIYLDTPCPEAFAHLKAHPKVRVIHCDAAYWKRQRRDRPEAHQLRQTFNATRAYRKQCKDLEWLAHIDVDEFLVSPVSISAQLRALPEEAITARVRPAEVLDHSDRYFRRSIRDATHGKDQTQALYPNWGAFVAGGMLSHRAGKIFVRTGIEGLKLRIHRSFVGDLKDPCLVELPAMDLCHFHARNWAHWLNHYRFRLEKGAYRAELRASNTVLRDAPTMHQVLAELEATHGEDGLRAFYNEFCVNSEDRRNQLRDFDLLCDHNLDLQAALWNQFPDYARSVAQIS